MNRVKLAFAAACLSLTTVSGCATSLPANTQTVLVDTDKALIIADAAYHAAAVVALAGVQGGTIKGCNTFETDRL